MSSEWSALAERAGNIFATPEWLQLWWEHGGRTGDVPAEEVRDGGRLVAILPLYVWRARPLRVARFVGHGAGDELGPLCLRGDDDRAAAALASWLVDRRADLLVGEQLPRDRGWTERLRARRLTAEGSPVLRFESRDWDAYLATRSRNFRGLVRRTERRLGELPGFRVRLTENGRQLDADLATLFALHRLRWSGRRTQFLADEPFHRRFARVALERGWLRLWTMELEGRPVAAWYGFRFAGAELYYQAGRDRSWDHASIGLGLLAHTVRAAQEDGAAEYRFLRGGEEYKYRFTDVDPGLETVAVTRTRRAAAALSLVVAARNLRRAAATRPRRSPRTAPRADAVRRGG